MLSYILYWNNGEIILLKNNKLALKNEQLSKKATDASPARKLKIKLCTLKAPDRIKTFHPLKNKKVNLHKLGITNATVTDKSSITSRTKRTKILTEHFRTLSGGKQAFWTTEIKIVDWLVSIGVPVKRLPHGLYSINNKTYNLSSVVVMANKQRAQQSLPLFYLEDLTEC